jgi:hypothetical protein
MCAVPDVQALISQRIRSALVNATKHTDLPLTLILTDPSLFMLDCTWQQAQEQIAEWQASGNERSRNPHWPYTGFSTRKQYDAFLGSTKSRIDTLIVFSPTFANNDLSAVQKTAAILQHDYSNILTLRELARWSRAGRRAWRSGPTDTASTPPKLLYDLTKISLRRGDIKFDDETRIERIEEGRPNVTFGDGTIIDAERLLDDAAVGLADTLKLHAHDGELDRRVMVIGSLYTSHDLTDILSDADLFDAAGQ